MALWSKGANFLRLDRFQRVPLFALADPLVTYQGRGTLTAQNVPNNWRPGHIPYLFLCSLQLGIHAEHVD